MKIVAYFLHLLDVLWKAIASTAVILFLILGFFSVGPLSFTAPNSLFLALVCIGFILHVVYIIGMSAIIFWQGLYKSIKLNPWALAKKAAEWQAAYEKYKASLPEKCQFCNDHAPVMEMKDKEGTVKAACEDCFKQQMQTRLKEMFTPKEGQEPEIEVTTRKDDQ